MSEISTYVSSGPQVPTRPGSPGKPQAGRSVAILPEEVGIPRCLLAKRGFWRFRGMIRA
ncbi:hypothetical protein V6L77_11345 [Pannonibacter sp. Pt2-lr]